MDNKELKIQLDKANAKVLYLTKLLSANNVVINEIPIPMKIAIIKEIRSNKLARLDYLREAADLSQSTFQYHKNKKSYIENHQSGFNLVKEIFLNSHKKYGVPRIRMELAVKYGVVMNKKKITRLMKEGNLVVNQPKRRKYSSYKGEANLKIDNVINRDFSATRPLEKITTDVTEFKYWWGKAYLQVYLDMFNGEIIAFNITKTIPLQSTLDLLSNLINAYGDQLKGTIVHSDRGWQYQEDAYISILKRNEMIQSMSRIGNALDNSIIESFNRTVKMEFFKDTKVKCSGFAIFREELIKYITYYNNDRIMNRLKTSPIKFRLEWEKKNGK